MKKWPDEKAEEEDKVLMEEEIAHRKQSEKALKGSKTDLKSLNEQLNERLNQLQASEERFRILVLTIPDIVYRIDQDGFFIFANEAIKRLGYESKEIIGKHFSEIILPADGEAISRSVVLSKYAGKKTGDKNAPKLFDERRTGARKTTSLERRLVAKDRKALEPGLMLPLGEDMLAVEINSAGIWKINPDAKKKEFIGTVGVIRDLTQRKILEKHLQEAYTDLEIKVEKRTAELRESEEKYRRLIESTSDWVWACDIAGCQTFANEAVKNILGYEAHVIQGTSTASLIHPEDREKVQKWFKTSVKEKKGWSNSVVRWKHKDGSTRFLESTAQPILSPAGDLVGFIGTDRDVTERKQAEEEREMLYDELKSLNLELEDTVRNRTMALELAVQEANAANRSKSKFLADMSHELRTPLNAVIGFSQVLQEKYFGELNEKQESHVRHIQESGEHLLELINDVLDIAKVEAGMLELELAGMKIASLLENSLVMIRGKALKHNISLDLHIVPELADLEITADERKLKQVIYNLLSNAAKFTPDDGSIRLEANLISDFGSRISELKKQEKIISDQSAIRNSQSAIEISVTDTGIGIAPKNLEKIFVEFHQVTVDMQYEPGGTGLGLTISKRFVELHGGRLWVESEGEGRGSRFAFVIPLD